MVSIIFMTDYNPPNFPRLWGILLATISGSNRPAHFPGASPGALQNGRQDYQSCEACAAIPSECGATSPALHLRLSKGVFAKYHRAELKRETGTQPHPALRAPLSRGDLRWRRLRSPLERGGAQRRGVLGFENTPLLRRHETRKRRSNFAPPWLGNPI